MPKLDPITDNVIRIPESIDTNARGKPLANASKIKHSRDTTRGEDDVSSWIDENDQTARAAAETAKHALDWISAGGGLATQWTDVTEANILAGYGLRYLPVGRDPSVQVPFETIDGVLNNAGSWNIYVTLPASIPVSRVRVQNRLVADGSVQQTLPTNSTQWAATSFAGLHDSSRAYRLVTSSNTGLPATVLLAGGSRLVLQVSGGGESDVLEELEDRKTIGLTDNPVLHTLSQTSITNTFVDTGQRLTGFRDTTIWAIEFGHVLYQFSPTAVNRLEGGKTAGSDTIDGENEIDLGTFGAVAKIEASSGAKLAFASKRPISGTVNIRRVLEGAHAETDARRFEVDPPVDDYDIGDVVLVGDQRKVLRELPEPGSRAVIGTANIDVVSRTTATGTSHWTGVSYSNVDEAPGSVGSWLTNPMQNIAFFGMEIPADVGYPVPLPHQAADLIASIGIKQQNLIDAYVPGGTDSDLPDRINMVLGWSNDSDDFFFRKTDTTFTYNDVLHRVYSIDYEPPTARHLGVRPLPDSAQVILLRVNPDTGLPTANSIFTYTDLVRHWVVFDSEQERRNDRDIENNSGRLDQLEDQVQQLREDQQNPGYKVPDGEVVIRERLPSAVRATPAVALVHVIEGQGRTRLRYVSKAGGEEWNDWTFEHVYSAAVTGSTNAGPSSTVTVNGTVNAGSKKIVVDGAGIGDLDNGQRFTIGSDTRVYTIAQWKSNLNEITMFESLAQNAADDTDLTFVGAPVAASVDTTMKVITISFGAGTTSIRALATQIEELTAFPTDDWHVDPYYFATTNVTVSGALTAQAGMSEGGMDLVPDGEYVRVDAQTKFDAGAGGLHVVTLPGLYQVRDYPAGLASNRFRAKFETKNGYTGVWSPGSFDFSYGPKVNIGDMIFDPTGGRIAGIWDHPDSGARDYQFFVDEDLFFGAMFDRVRWVWGTVGDHRQRNDETADGVEPVVLQVQDYHPADVSHNNLLLSAYDPDGTRILHNLPLNTTGHKVTQTDKVWRIFESVGANSVDALTPLTQHAFCDIEVGLDVDTNFSLIREWTWPMAQDDWSDPGTRISGVPGFAQRSKAWIGVDVFSPTTAHLNALYHDSLEGLKFRRIANQAAFDALTPDSNTVYFVDGPNLGSRRIYIGSKEWAD